MGWKIIEIETGQQLNLFLDNLVVLQEKNKIIIPLNDIDVLLINNYKAKITIQLINALAQHNILTIICDTKYLPTCNILPIIGNYNTLKILEQQLQWNHVYKAELWKEIIYLKILGQASLIKYLFQESEAYVNLLSLSNEIDAYDITNREGHASKIYWHCLYGKDWKRHNDDYANILLNYGYMVLRSYVTRSIIKKGLDPRISIFHKSFNNYFALASDLMEPFRFIVDHIVYELIKTNEVDFYNHKQSILETFNHKIIINNQAQYLTNAIDDFIDAIIRQNKLPQIKYDFKQL